MHIFTITANDKEEFKAFFSQDSCECIDKPGYFTIAATDDEDFIAGVLQFYVDEDYIKGYRAKLTYLFVDEDFRGEGIGTALIRAFKDIASESRIDFVIAEIFEESDRELAILLENEGFAKEGEVAYYTLPLVSLVKKSSIKKADTSKVKSLEELPAAEAEEFYNSISTRIVQDGIQGYDMKVSSYMAEDKKRCLLLVKKSDTEEHEIAFVYASEGSEDELISLLAFSAGNALKEYGAFGVLHIACREQTEFKLMSMAAAGNRADKYILYASKDNEALSPEVSEISEYMSLWTL